MPLLLYKISLVASPSFLFTLVLLKWPLLRLFWKCLQHFCTLIKVKEMKILPQNYLHKIKYMHDYEFLWWFIRSSFSQFCGSWNNVGSFLTDMHSKVNRIQLVINAYNFCIIILLPFLTFSQEILSLSLATFMVTFVVVNCIQFSNRVSW